MSLNDSQPIAWSLWEGFVCPETRVGACF